MRHVLGGESAALHDRVESDLLGVGDALGELGERVAVVEIRRVDDVPGGAELVGEGEAPVGQPLCMVEEK